MGSGRKGTADEEEYLLKSVTKLVGRFDTLQGMVSVDNCYDASDRVCRR